MHLSSTFYLILSPQLFTTHTPHSTNLSTKKLKKSTDLFDLLHEQHVCFNIHFYFFT